MLQAKQCCCFCIVPSLLRFNHGAWLQNGAVPPQPAKSSLCQHMSSCLQPTLITSSAALHLQQNALYAAAFDTMPEQERPLFSAIRSMCASFTLCSQVLLPEMLKQPRSHNQSGVLGLTLCLFPAVDFFAVLIFNVWSTRHF